MANHTYQTVIDAVNAILNNEKQEAYTEKVIDRLVSFGYTPTSADVFALVFAVQKAYSHIVNETNQSTIPTGLFNFTVDRISGEFLSVKYQTGQLSLSGLDLSSFVQSVSEGDTSVSFGSAGSDIEKFDLLLKALLKDGDLLCYRKIRW